jgi:hypothetical protein
VRKFLAMYGLPVRVRNVKGRCLSSGNLYPSIFANAQTGVSNKSPSGLRIVVRPAPQLQLLPPQLQLYRGHSCTSP